MGVAVVDNDTFSALCVDQPQIMCTGRIGRLEFAYQSFANFSLTHLPLAPLVACWACEVGR